MLPKGSYHISSPDKFESIIKGDVIQRNVLKSQSNVIGLNSIIEYPNQDALEIQLSSKILSQNYLQGININTIQQAHEEIVASGLIDLPISHLMDAVIRRSDFCSLMPIPQKQMHTLLDSFELNNYPRKKMDATRYGRKDNQGFAIHGKLSTRKIHFKLYDKYLDLKKKANLGFCQSVGYYWIESNTKDLLRIESEFSRGLQKELKKIIGLNDSEKVTLNHVLNTEKKILLHSLNKLLPTASDKTYMPEQVAKILTDFKIMQESNKLTMGYNEFMLIRSYYHLLVEENGCIYSAYNRIKLWNPNNYRSKAVRHKLDVAKILYDTEHKAIETSKTQSQYLNQIKYHLSND